MALNLNVPEYKRDDLAIYLRKQLLKKKSAEICEKSKSSMEQTSRYSKRKNDFNHCNNDYDDGSSSDDNSTDSYLETKQHIPPGKKQKQTDEKLKDAKPLSKRNTRETKHFRHF